jgi:[ribosomal protein S18]-alanine N-acetyltransferase
MAEGAEHPRTLPSAIYPLPSAISHPMSSYRFCRTDDIGLLVDALNRCWLPHFPGEEAVTRAAFKRSIRDLQVWCSSCMVAFADSDPIAVLIGAKRPSGTLIHKIAVHPDHLRQGHGRHLLTSISSKLAILGPPRIAAEVPEENGPARALFEACRYVEEAVQTDYTWVPAPSSPPSTAGLIIPVTVDDLAANGLFETQPSVCWKRSVETLRARKDEIAGFAAVLDDRIEAYILHIEDEILALRTLVEDGGASLKHLLYRLGFTTVRLPKVHPAEIPGELLETLGFRSAGGHILFATVAQSG